MWKLKEYFSYKKFADPRYRILYLFNDYFLQKESIGVMREMGHDVQLFRILPEPKTMLDALLKTSISFKPDCIMAINHCGFDSEGRIANVLSDLLIPVIIWYLDDFRFIINNAVQHANSNTLVFTFEKNHVQLLKDYGFEHTFYLPSAASWNPKMKYSHSHYDYLSNCTVFVGNTFQDTKRRWSKPDYYSLLEEINKEDKFQEPIDNIFSVIIGQRSKFNSVSSFYHYGGFVAAHATHLYRKYYLQNLRTQEFHIFGDKNWQQSGIDAQLHMPSDYENETPYIYNQSLINLNLSSQQLETSVNQRVFDVPATGGFLLTDWKDSLDELFNIKKEVLYFQSIDELNDLVSFYEGHPHRREEVMKNAERKVQKDHLVQHRIQKMLSIVKNVFSQPMIVSGNNNEHVHNVESEVDKAVVENSC